MLKIPSSAKILNSLRVQGSQSQSNQESYVLLSSLITSVTNDYIVYDNHDSRTHIRPTGYQKPLEQPSGYAFDAFNDNGEVWGGTGGGSLYMIYDLGENNTHTISRFEILKGLFPSLSYGDVTIKSFEVYLSDTINSSYPNQEPDSDQFTLLFQVNNLSPSSESVIYDIPIYQRINKRYVKIVMTNNIGEMTFVERIKFYYSTS